MQKILLTHDVSKYKSLNINHVIQIRFDNQILYYIFIILLLFYYLI